VGDSSRALEEIPIMAAQHEKNRSAFHMQMVFLISLSLLIKAMQWY